MPQFVHLHLHTQYSILDGASDIKKVVARLLVLVLLEAVAHNIDLASEDGLNTRLGCHVVELLDAIHIAVVGDGQRWHAELFGTSYHLFDVGGAVQNGVLCM